MRAQEKATYGLDHGDVGRSDVHSCRKDSDDVDDLLNSKRAADEWEAKRSQNSSRPKQKQDTAPKSPTSEMKPLPPIKPSGFGTSTALPPIRAAAASAQALSQQADSLELRQKQVSDALKQNQQLLVEQRKAEEDLRKQIDVDTDNSELRARHMREQRDKLVALKKQQRDAKVAEEVLRNGSTTGAQDEIAAKIQEFTSQVATVKIESKEDEEDERKRANMRTALARRMKRDLIGTDEDKRHKAREDQFSELDKKLKEVETLRVENQRREYSMQEQIRRQQAKIARNVQLSASLLPKDDL